MFITAILTTFNCKNYVKDSLNSIFKQTFPPFEVVVVDDHSTDGTFEILQTLKNEFNFLLIRNRENLERCQTRNRGVKAFKGDFVCFLDCDDLWSNTYIENISQVLKKNVDAVYSPPKGFINGRGEITKVKKPLKEINLRRLLFSGRVGYPSGSCFKKETFLRLGGYKDRYLMREDWEIFLRFLMEGTKIELLPRGEYFIREHSDRSSKSKRFLKASLKVYKDYLPYLEKEEKALISLHIAAQCLRFGFPKCGRRIFLKTLLEHPKAITFSREMWEVLKRLVR